MMKYILATLMVASMIIFFVVITSIIPFKQDTVFADMPEEMIEVIFYFNNISMHVVNDLSDLKDADKDSFKGIIKDLEASDQWEKVLLNDYSMFPDDERVRNAIIEFHKNKAEMLNELYKQIKNKNYINNKNSG